MQNHQGKRLRLAVKALDLTQEEAATKLGMTRQNIGLLFKKEELPEDIIHLVKAKLKIDVSEPEANPLKEFIALTKRIEELELSQKEQKQDLALLKELILQRK